MSRTTPTTPTAAPTARPADPATATRPPEIPDRPAVTSTSGFTALFASDPSCPNEPPTTDDIAPAAPPILPNSAENVLPTAFAALSAVFGTRPIARSNGCVSAVTMTSASSSFATANLPYQFSRDPVLHRAPEREVE